MTSRNQTQFTQDPNGKKLTVTASFNATSEQVWDAWTQSQHLDQWWAPKPWKAETRKLDFREGGQWLYAMTGPDGEKQWARFDYTSVNDHKSFAGRDFFSDEHGNPDQSMPGGITWNIEFLPSDSDTQVVVNISFKSEEDMNRILEMGFEEGFRAGLDNLREYLGSAAQSR